LNPKQIFIRDACFGLDGKWRKEFLQALNRNKVEKIIWAETRIELLDKEDIDLLSDLKFVVAFGVESYSERMLNIMKKSKNTKHYLKKCEETLSYLNKEEVPYHVCLMFNHPGETYETYRETIQFFSSFVQKQVKMSGFIRAANYAYFPGSHVHLHVEEYEEAFGTIVKNKEWWKERRNHYPLAMSVIASDSLRNTFGDKINYWVQDIQEINQQILYKMPLKTRIFWYTRMQNEKDMML
jgi:radical SAM superfamily enzyme YgiQ (UPF0313 family)